jgi:hypothetical protein
MSELLLPNRAQQLSRIDGFNEPNWNLLCEAIRPEIRGTYLDKAQRALSVELNDAAINYFWNAVEADLRNKVIAYGIEYFGSAINNPSLRNKDDLKDDVKAYELIQGCYALGIIGSEAHFQLQHAREIRNCFSAAHESIGEIDKLETLNFIKNCVKYVLCFDPPAPGFQIRDFIQYLSHGDIDLDESMALLQSQSSIIYGPLIHNFLSTWIDSSISINLKNNIKLIAPKIWEISDDQVRSEVGQRYASLKERPTPDAAREALEFIKLVNGISYIPENFRFAVFKRYAKALIDAYMGWNNFRNEPSNSLALSELGNEVPNEAATIYSKAVLLSYVGNSYGYSNGAQSYNESMIRAFTPTSINALFSVLNTDSLVAATLISNQTLNRFKSLLEMLKDKTLTPAQKQQIEDFEASNQTQLKAHFQTLHARLSRVK